ncbi:Methyl-CpG-binding domain protein 4-like protein [Ananas comosus]|uniref:Methyl-CpG-binding domain protein 4-like protein n=1 Tax=Ananas comosus TaxID=4615 RepID=A0A199UN66_ANACO|nr:Methyl-CpG-binding domain protein 4-like protein [Ananas comosus]
MARDSPSLDQILSSFAYKPSETTTTTTTTTTKKKKKRSVGGGDNDDAPPPPMKRRRRRPRPPSSAASSYLRTTVAGKPLVVSRFFPLPPDASPPIVLYKKEHSHGTKRRKMTTTKKQKRNPKNPKNHPIPNLSGDRDGVDDDHDGDDDDDVDRDVKKRRRRSKQRSQLSAAEKMSEAYRRVAAEEAWEPPASCHSLLQERHSFDPWRVLIICMLLNITTGEQVRRVLPGLFLLCPDAETTTKVPAEEIEKVIQSLGLQRKRARMIKQFSLEYLSSDWTHVTQLHGIGKYAADAYAIFCVGKPEEVVPQDHKLIDYWKFVCGKDGSKECAAEQN